MWIEQSERVDARESMVELVVITSVSTISNDVFARALLSVL